ncbi:unnamed protein product [Tetraodon nigroviridis]|uniref:(spotted green pufferfish) hypothetical protein n=1 Tax=Tetraodon nigroviridis TaxID=99883 RepID=Q4RWG4_TETNG|nr:unnamed protein product [Tetraodon nigroviridis]
MPQPWSRCIIISKKDLEQRYPGGKKVTHYKRAKLEKFGLYLQPDGLLTRLTTYKDLSCTEVELVKEWYQGRNDHLEHREFNQVLQVTTEHFQPGRRCHLLLHRFSESEHEMEFNSSARADSLVRRVLSKSAITETFKGRFDFLHYRQVTFSIPDGLSDVQHIPLKVDPSVKPLSRLALYRILQDLLKHENSAVENAKDSRNETAEQQEWQLDHVDDYLVPHLIDLDFPETLSPTDFDNIIAKCLQEFKESRKAVVNFLKEHHKKLREKQRWYQQNQDFLSKEAVEEYRDYCSEKTLILKVVQARLERYC